MGSWIGRLAARYRMRVDEFLVRAGVDFDLEVTNVGWLLASRLSDDAIERLARRTRYPPERIHALQTPENWLENRKHMRYCAKCLFVNPADVSAPRWKREWLDPEARDCSEHGSPLASIAVGRIRRCDHFAKVLETISKTEHLNRLIHERGWR